MTARARLLRPRRPARPRRLTATAVLALLLAALLLGSAVTAAPAAATGENVRERQWALGEMGAYQVWKRSRGAGTTVAVLDTGVDPTHPDLTGSVLTGTDTVGTGARRGDLAWARHGTAMAALIAGHGHGPGGAYGVLGIAPDAQILPVRVILENADPSRPAPTTRNGAAAGPAPQGNALARGIRWAVDHGADVINLSLGDDSGSAHPDQDEDAAVRYAVAHGVVVVASAGNGGAQHNRSSYPAAYPGVIPVAAAGRDGRRADFSTHRWYSSVAAPGVEIPIADPNRQYYRGWGTSASAALVSGAVALIRDLYPKLSPAQVKAALEAGTRPPGPRTRSTPGTSRTPRPVSARRGTALGAGLVDLPGALAEAARMKPARAEPAPSAARSKYLGKGPRRTRPETHRPNPPLLRRAAPYALAAGLALLATAALLRWSPARARLALTRCGKGGGR